MTTFAIATKAKGKNGETIFFDTKHGFTYKPQKIYKTRRGAENFVNRIREKHIVKTVDELQIIEIA